jgi:hypothetical protein
MTDYYVYGGNTSTKGWPTEEEITLEERVAWLEKRVRDLEAKRDPNSFLRGAKNWIKNKKGEKK